MQTEEQNIAIGDKEKRKRKILIIVGVVLVFIVLLVALWSHKKYAIKPAPKTKIIQDSGMSNKLKKQFAVNYEVKLSKQQKDIQRLNSQFVQFKKEKANGTYTQNNAAKHIEVINKQATNRPFGGGKQTKTVIARSKLKRYPPAQGGGIRGKYARYVGLNKGRNRRNTTRYVPLHNLIDVTESPKSQVSTAQKQKSQNGNKNKKKTISIPAGSFVSTILLNGLDAPTGGSGTGNPVPILMRVSGFVQLPNQWRSNLKNCFILGEAKGSLSSQRVYIRVDKLSCVTPKGKRLTVAVTGYVSGADGKVGLAGRVVSKQGAMLARTLVAGFLQGVGQAFQQSQQTISLSPLTGGSTTQASSLDGKTMLKMGIGGGVGKATEKLADFYMNMAKEMFPVIEIDSGRHATVILLSGVSL